MTGCGAAVSFDGFSVRSQGARFYDPEPQAPVFSVRLRLDFTEQRIVRAEDFTLVLNDVEYVGGHFAFVRVPEYRPQYVFAFLGQPGERWEVLLYPLLEDYQQIWVFQRVLTVRLGDVIVHESRR